MKEFEIVAKIYNACGGIAHAQTLFDEAELNDPADYIRRKHSTEYQKFTCETNADGQICYIFDNGRLTYHYTFTEL